MSSELIEELQRKMEKQKAEITQLKQQTQQSRRDR